MKESSLFGLERSNQLEDSEALESNRKIDVFELMTLLSSKIVHRLFEIEGEEKLIQEFTTRESLQKIDQTLRSNLDLYFSDCNLIKNNEPNTNVNLCSFGSNGQYVLNFGKANTELKIRIDIYEFFGVENISFVNFKMEFGNKTDYIQKMQKLQQFINQVRMQAL